MPRRARGAYLYFRRDAGVWIIRDGSRQRRTGCGEGELDAAERALAAYIASRAGPLRTGPRPASELTVGEALALSLDHKGETVSSPMTLAAATERLVEFWADLPCDAVKRSTCAAYVKHRATPRRDHRGKVWRAGPSTVRRELGVLQAALNHAHAEGVLIHPVKVTLADRSPPRDRWLTRSEAARLLRAASPHVRRFILLSLHTGRRAGAVLALTWARVDLDAGVIRFRDQGEAETNKRRGRVTLPRQMLAHLRRWKAAARAGETHVVSSRGKPIACVRGGVESAAARAGLSADVTPHVLKHTAITWAVMNPRVSPEAAAEYFATSPAVIRSTYWHHSPNHQREVIEAMERRS